MAWELTQRAWVRMSALVGSLTVIGLVAFSRIYLDVHWTTDVVAGLLLGSVLLVAAYRAYDYRPRRLLAAAATRRPTA
jgi:undecaprenyl-diphosphatase